MVDKNNLDTVVSSDFTQYMRPAGIALVVIGGVFAGIALLGYCGTSFTILLKIVSHITRRYCGEVGTVLGAVH